MTEEARRLFHKLPKSKRRHVYTCYLDKHQISDLNTLREKTKVPAAIYVREGVDYILKKYGVWKCKQD